MATLSELTGLARDNQPLLDKITGAVMIAANGIYGESGATANHAERLAWAARVVNAPAAQARKMMSFVLAANAANSVAQITGASDAAIQNNVDAAVDFFALNDTGA